MANSLVSALVVGFVRCMVDTTVQVPPMPVATLEESVPAPRVDVPASSSHQTVHGRPIVLLPDMAEDVNATRMHGYVNGLRQDILLKAGPIRSIQNSITVLARTNDRQTLDESVPLYKPTEAGIRSEIGGQFPHIPMQVAERESSNAYGPYGMALGRGDGDVRCLYMWQWIDENRLPLDAGIKGPVSLRVRLCQAATTFDAMAALMDHLTIGGSGAIETAGADDQVHIIEAPVAADASADTPRKRVYHTIVQHPARVAKQRELPVPQIAVVPSGSPRYLASPSVGAATARQTTVDTTPTASMKLSSDLPPQAYLGPKGSAY